MFSPQVGEPPTAPLSGPDVCGSAPGGRADEAVWQLFPKAAAEGAFLSAGPGRAGTSPFHLPVGAGAPSSDQVGAYAPRPLC